jgi:peptidoglycan L-alanyl-D-glutamate endopeptidase CwlK
VPSRKIEDLIPALQPMALALVGNAKQCGYDVRIICTLRSLEEQADIYASGRTKPGPILTKSKPGQSMHNPGPDGRSRAFDIGVFVGGEYKASDDYYQLVGQNFAPSIEGLEWGGNWRGFKDCPHYQFAGFEKA